MTAADNPTALGEEHRDGRIWVDNDGDLWQRHPHLPGEWLVTRRLAFAITYGLGEPIPAFGPYRMVLDA